MLRTVLMALLLTSFSTAALATHDLMKPSSHQETFTTLTEKLRQHPALAAYVQRAEALRHMADSERGLPDPMIFIQEQDWPIGSNMARESEEKMVGFKQIIPAFGTRNAKAERNEIEARKIQLLGEFAFEGMNVDLIKVLANRQRIEEQDKILQEQRGLLKTEQKSLKGRIAANQTSVSALSMSDADLADIDLMRTTLYEQKHETLEMLRNMTGEMIDVKLPDIQMTAWNNDPDKTWPVILTDMDIRIAQKDVDLRYSEFNPSIDIETAYGRMNNRDNAGTIMIGLSIPLWAAESQKPRLSSAKASLRASSYDKDSVRREMIEKLIHLRAQINASEKKIAILKRKEFLLNTSKGAQTREYAAGQEDFSTPLKALRGMLSVRYQIAEEKAKRTTLIADFNHYIIERDRP